MLIIWQQNNDRKNSNHSVLSVIPNHEIVLLNLSYMGDQACRQTMLSDKYLNLLKPTLK